MISQYICAQCETAEIPWNSNADSITFTNISCSECGSHDYKKKTLATIQDKIIKRLQSEVLSLKGKLKAFNQ